jgi:molybdenum cofactor cytidylyltransferase
MIRAAAIVLAAGRSTRYRDAGGSASTKLVAEFRGEPMVRHAVRAALASAAAPVVVVTGHARGEVEAALSGEAVVLVHNPDFAEGLATSLRCGLGAIGPEVEAVVILLGDMPLVGTDTIEALLASAHRHPEAEAVVPVYDGLRGNPVLLRRALFPAAARLMGDEGARRLLRDPSVTVLDLPLASDAVRFDVDEPSALDGM